MSDDQQLFRWKPDTDSQWVVIEDGTVRPSRIEADFLVGDLMVTVLGLGDENDVKITKISGLQWKPEVIPIDYPTMDSSDWRVDPAIRAAETFASEPLRAEDMSRFDPELAAAQLKEAAVISYAQGPNGRPATIRLGGGAWIRIEDLRRYLSGPEGAPRPGPKRKASHEQVAKIWRAATRKGEPAPKAVAEKLDVSMTTAHRYIAAARKAGALKENA